jgi:hypothetical protein
MNKQIHKWESVLNRKIKTRDGYNFELVICTECDVLGRKFDNGNIAIEADYWRHNTCREVTEIRERGGVYDAAYQ